MQSFGFQDAGMKAFQQDMILVLVESVTPRGLSNLLGWKSGICMSYRARYEYILTFLADMVSLICAVVLSRFIFDAWFQMIPEEHNSQEYLQFYLMLAVAFAIGFILFDQEEDITHRSLKKEILRAAVMTFAIGAVLALLLVLGKMPLGDSRYFFVGILAFNFILQPVFHTSVKSYLRESGKASPMKKLVGVLTVADRAQPLLEDLKKDWSKEICGVALMDATKEEIGQTIYGLPIKAGFEDFMTWVRRDALDEVYLDVPYDSGASLENYLAELESMGLDVHFSVPLLEKLYRGHPGEGWRSQAAASLERRGNTYLIGISTVHHNIRDMLLKRIIDICGALVGLVISIPFIAIVAIPLKIESPGPLFFKQKRVGLNGRYFYIYKLRSMYMDAEERKKELMAKNEMNGFMFKMTDDPRITKVGKFIRKTSIDELPQFWNVLRGDMSLVGTRPPTVDEYKHYESHHKRRLSMKPGITGMWQVSGRSSIENFEDVVSLDTQYIDNWSLGLDIQILIKTVAVVFAGSGAK